MNAVLIVLAIIGVIALVLGIATIFLVVKLTPTVKHTDFEAQKRMGEGIWKDDEGNEYKNN